MKVIDLKSPITINAINGNVFIINSDGQLIPVEPGMQIQPGQLILINNNSSINAELADGAQAIISNDDANSFGNVVEALDGSKQYPAFLQYDINDEQASKHGLTTINTHAVSQNDIAAVQAAILNGEDPTKVAKPSHAGNEPMGSSIEDAVTVAYDNDQMLAEAGHDTDYRPLEEKERIIDGGREYQPSLDAAITIDSISQDDVVTAAESHTPQTITGTVGGDVKVGDVVTVSLDGKEIGTTKVVEHDGKLVWSMEADGQALLQAGVDRVSATVTATDAAGNSATANATHDYSVDVQASITINPITGDNLITQAEGHEPKLPITGTVGKDVEPGDKVVVTVNGHDYTTTVTADKTWTVEVSGDDILHADKAIATVTTSYGIPHEATATTSESYDVTINAKITIETIAGDGVVNGDESHGKVPVTGVVGGDVEEGDIVTVTVNGKDYTTTVTHDKTWTVDVDGGDLVENGGDPIHATVTACDGAGHCATAEDNKGYEVDTDIAAKITIDSISQDDVVTAAESHTPQTITGTVGGDVKVGDVVTVSLDGKEIGTTKVVEHDGKLVWSIEADGQALLQAGVDRVSATVTATDAAGNSATANATHDYSVDVQASITINPITGDNLITQAEGHEPKLPITGTVGKDVEPGDKVVVTVNGHDYTTTVTADKTWTVEVSGDDILHADKAIATVTTSYGIPHEATATDTEGYTVQIDAGIQITSIAGDNVVNKQESGEKVPVTGVVGNDVKPGDTVTVTIGDKTYTTTVTDNKTWTVDVDGSALVGNKSHEVHASVTTSDGAGHEASANTDKPYDVDTDIAAKITIDSISQDDVVTAAESHTPQTITGTVGGDVKVGDVVTVSLDGKEIGTTKVVEHDGKLVWSMEADGQALLQAGVDRVSATVTATDAAGNSATANATHDYSVDVQASITINPITGDNIITQAEGHEPKLPITGTVGKDVEPGDKVVVTVNGHDYTTTVTADKTWTVEVSGDDILHADKAIATVTTSYGIPHEATATDTEGYTVQIDAGIQITSIAGDNVVNKQESGEKVPVTGVVGNDVKPGDTVTVTIGDKTYTTTVSDNKTWTVDVDGSALVGNKSHEVHASVTTSDGAGHEASANTDKPYDVDTDIAAQVTITSIADDNVINMEEAKGHVAIKGTVGGDVKAGDTVTLTVDGKEIGTATVVDNGGKLEWTATDIDGSTLANAKLDDVTATVTATDAAGNSASAEDTQAYEEKTLSAQVDITAVAGDNVLNADESKDGAKVSITGTVGGDVKAGDTVTLTVDGKEIGTATVVDNGGKLEWTATDIDGHVLANASKDDVTATVTVSDKFGNSASAEDTQAYEEKTLSAQVDITAVAGDNVLNADESKDGAKVSITGTVGGDVKAGDTVTLTVDGKEIGTATVVDNGDKLEWTATDIDGHVLANASKDDVTATVSIKDSYGNTASATDNQAYEEKTLSAQVDITAVAGDNVLNADESKDGAKVSITGTVGGDVKAGDTVTLTVDGKEIGTATVVDNGGKLEWTATDIDGHVLANASKDDVTATVTVSDKFGNSASAEDTQAYEEKTLSAQVDITAVAGDNVLNADESKDGAKVSITGTVGGDVKAGDTVTLTVDGKEIGTATVVDNGGKLEWTATDIDGHVLANASKDDVTATVTVSDKFGNSASAEDTQAYEEKTLSAQVDITAVAGDNVLNADESKDGAKVSITGTVGGDVKAGDTVTLTVDGKEIGTATVVDNGGKLEWTATDIDGHVLANASKDDVTATVSIKDSYGNTASATDNQAYEEKTLSAQVDITAVAGDNVLNADESKDGAKVSITGTVGGDVKAGDTVTLTVDGKEIGTATVVDNGGKLEWTATDIDGHVLANASKDDVTATVSIKDSYGNTASATDNQAYEEKTLSASVTIDGVTADNIINEKEATETITLHGTVGGDVKVGDEVTITVDGKHYKTSVTENDGQLGWALPVDGSVLAHAKVDQIQAHVSIKDNYGNTAEANAEHDYTVKTLDASITIDDVTSDNVISKEEAANDILLHGQVGGDVKLGDTVVITVDGHDYQTKVIERNGQLGWQVEVAGSVLANATADKIHAVVKISDKAGNTETATADHDYKVTDLNVTITVDSINDGKAITGEEHDNNSPITVTGSVGGDAKVGDTVTLQLGDKSVDVKVEDQGNGKLGYTAQVPGSYFEPNQNHGFSGDVHATITISDTYGNSASAVDDKPYDGYGRVEIGGNDSNIIDGTGYNDILVGDSSPVEIKIEPKTISFILDISGSMATAGETSVQAMARHLDIAKGDDLSKVIINDKEYSISTNGEFGQEVINLVASLGLISQNPTISFTHASGIVSSVSFNDSIVTESRLELAKDALIETLHILEDSYTEEQLAITTFNLATFSSGYMGTTSFKYDPESKQLIALEYHDKGVNDYSTPPPVLGNSMTEYVNSLKPSNATDYDIVLENVLALLKPEDDNTLFFLSDGEDTVGGFNVQDVINKLGADDIKQLNLRLVSMGMAVDTEAAKHQLEAIAHLGRDYGETSHYIDVTNMNDLKEQLGIEAQKIVGGGDTIYGSSHSDILFGDFMNYAVLGYPDGHLPDGLKPEDALKNMIAKDAGKTVSEVNEKDIFDYIESHPELSEIPDIQGGADKLYGNEGDDILYGQSKSDTLVGGQGDDILNGGSGDDILVADQGNDILVGGKGDDVFKLDFLAKVDESATVTIKDLDSGDHLDLSSILTKDNGLDTLLQQVSSAKIEDGKLDLGFHDDKQHVVIENLGSVYPDVSGSTNDIVTSLYNQHLFDLPNNS
ncbi:retention module-containing protein [Photobacterium damselae subsp. damselae]|uniref:retention module-containing protein n=4 Tax=Photobacterium damselae TaxID=38293 RepID=UPI001F1B8E47|nr:retention module-containing protein [Photobacterium damselae]UKA05071.1 retention module-containing protein [Photobacterium damselae subsp. damselae]UKA20177.1 retention module-containing protein [Photobacterium damselae subsp. damselae]